MNSVLIFAKNFALSNHSPADAEMQLADLRFVRKTGGEGGIRTPGRLLHLRRFSKALLSTTQPPLRSSSLPNKALRRSARRFSGFSHLSPIRVIKILLFVFFRVGGTIELFATFVDYA